MALAHAILASLMKQPATGYDLAKEFDRVVSHFWHATHQQIYRELSIMEKDAWVKSKTSKQKDKPDRKVYSITALGRKVLAAWVAQPVPVSGMREDLMVKLQAGTAVAPGVLLEEIARHGQSHQGTLQFYEKVLTSKYPDAGQGKANEVLEYLVLRCGILYEQAYLNWCNEAMAVIAANEDINTSSTPDGADQ
ncbi:PadR family transcriptional regulator [Undibacterium sp. TS12]|uniref:PadR family transcriptional regulator n=1 Tax=Undibacterium sp. TS12 TaxID=2908202 RepID=UPI002409D033|nr:PadR family transcriptional regulator [Undibacterium sp. TS12]